MSQRVKVKLNYAGVGELLRSAEMKDCLAEIAAEKAAALGSGYGTDTYSAPTRVIASVFTETREAYQDNLQNNTLLKSLKV